MVMISALLTALGLGFLYFISAIPVSVMAGAPLWAAAVAAWCGYSLGAGSILLLGAPLRTWLLKKFPISLQHNDQKFFWRVWKKYGLIGLGLVAPITIGPQVSTVLLLALGERPWRILTALSLGALPCTLGFSLIVKFGLHVFR